MDLIERQAAIDALRTCYDTEIVTMDNGDEYINYGDAVGEIEQLPSALPEPCEDAVSRKDCLQALSHLMDVEGFRSGWAVSRANVECMLKAMPSVTPKQRTDLLKAEIKRMKRSFKTCINSDYYTGYMSALSAVEGYIAQWEGDAE